MDRYWAVSSLLQGWVRSDAKVAALFNEIPTWSDELLNNLSSLLPDIYQDKRACRSRLLGIANGVECARLDFITQGLTKLGSDASDQEAVDTLINKLGKGSPLYEPGAAFILGYSKNPDVRQHAIRTLKTHEPMLAVLARAYETDDEIRKKLLGLLNPLPTALRYDLLEAAIAEMDSRQAFRSLLADYDHEVNSDLKIASSIHYHRSLARGKPDESHLATLKDRLNVLGSNFQERRAAAFAGILLLGHLGDFVPLWECGDKPMHVRIGSGYGNESDSLAELICEKWIELKTAFGETLASRFGDFGSNGYEFWKYLSPHIHSSTAARRDFLAYCHSTQDLLALNSLRTFAEEQPSSERLLELCWKGFDREILKTQKKQDSPWATQKMRLEIAYILKHHFGNRADVIDRVAKMLKGGGAPEAVALLLLDPQNAAWSDLKFTSAEIAEKFHDWVAAVNLSAAQDPAHTFLDLTCGMLNREEHGIWNFQEIINHAVIERLQRDENVAKLFKERLGSNPTLNELASIPQYLMAAGAMDSETLELAKTLLRDEGKYDLPRTAYDGLSDEIRCVARSLMEVISPSVSLH